MDSNIELDSLYSFFKDLNAEPDFESHQTIDNMSIEDDEEVLNSPITDCEILKCIKSLKNNKACSNDQIINEYIKSTSEIMLPLYNSFFSPPVRSTRRAIVVTPVVCFAFAFAFPFPSHCVKVFQMLISQQSLLTEASNLELRYLGGSSEIPRE